MLAVIQAGNELVDELASSAAFMTRNHSVVQPFVFADVRKWIPMWANVADGMLQLLFVLCFLYYAYCIQMRQMMKLRIKVWRNSQQP